MEPPISLNLQLHPVECVALSRRKQLVPTILLNILSVILWALAEKAPKSHCSIGSIFEVMALVFFRISPKIFKEILICTYRYIVGISIDKICAQKLPFSLNFLVK